MPRPDEDAPRPRHAPDEASRPSPLTPEQIGRWADRVADGREEFPADLADPDRTVLADAVRARLRDRLVRHVARAVAGRMSRPDAAAREE